MSQDADVLVIGAGMVGAACAWALAQAGLDVRVLDDRRASATAAGMGHLVMMDDNPAELALSGWSLALWRELAPAMPAGCDHRNCGTLWIAANDAEMAEAEHKQRRLRERGITSRLLDARALRAAEPALRKGLAGALEVGGDGVVYAPSAAEWLLAQGGARIRVEHAEVTAIEGTALRLADGSRRTAPQVVLASGMHATALCPELPLRPKKGHLLITDRYPGTVQGIYSDLSGQGSVTAARMAVEEMGGKVLGKPIEIVFADHQNKPDVAANLARGWLDQGKVDMITDLPTSSTALAVMEIAKQKNRIVMPSSGLATAILGEKCTPLTAQWTTNTYALAAGTARALVKEGKKSWYFITADYTFGHSLEKDATEVIKANGGTVVGSSRHPFPGNDFSSFLLKAQASGADVVALANAGNDTVNAIKQANEYGITRKQVVAPLLTYISDVHSIGLEKAQGMYLSEAFYWDFDERSRAWSKKFFEKQKRMPTAAQAGVYSATLSYLKAVQAAGTDEAKAVMAQLRKMTIDDAVIRNGKLREDGALVHDMLLLQVKTPAESKAPWDYYKVKAVLHGADVYPPVNPACQIAK